MSLNKYNGGIQGERPVFLFTNLRDR